MIITDKAIIRLYRSSDKEDPKIRMECLSFKNDSRDCEYILEHDSAVAFVRMMQELLDPEFLDKYRKFKKESDEEERAHSEMMVELAEILEKFLNKWDSVSG